MTVGRKLTQDELLAELKDRFGGNWQDWAFTCPQCGDTATGLDISVALADHKPTDRDGSPVTVDMVLGQQCIGRITGALSGQPTSDSGRSLVERGCDWAAFGLFRGPWEVVMPDGHSAWSFPLAEAATTESGA